MEKERNIFAAEIASLTEKIKEKEEATQARLMSLQSREAKKYEIEREIFTKSLA